MKTKYFFLAGFAAMLASCANEEYIGDNSPNATLEQTGDGSIQFGFDLQNATRADQTGATAASTLGNQFIVYGEKGESGAGAATPANLVFQNYQVNYTANTAFTSTSNTNNWEYVGYTHSSAYQAGITTKDGASAAVNALSTAQTIKYWDYGAASYTFTAVSAGQSDLGGGKVTIQKLTSDATNVYGKGYNIHIAADADPSKVFIADRKVIAKSSNADRTAVNSYGGNVTLSFRNLLSHIRVGMYETVSGYTVTINKFKYADAVNPAFSAMSTEGTDKFYANVPNVATTSAADLVVTYWDDASGAENTPKIAISGTSGANYVALGGADADHTGLKASSVLATTITTPTYNETSGAYTAVYPQEANITNMKLKLDYTLTSPTGEIITVKNATAEVPAAYLQWKPNYKYTYIFKISQNTNGYTGEETDPAGLYPITFDAAVVVAEDGLAEYITTVAEPSITTIGGTAGNYSVNASDYAASTDVYATVMDNSTLATLSASNFSIYDVTSSDDTNFPVTEASVAEALIEGSTWTKAQADNKKITCAAGPALTFQKTAPAEDGTTKTLHASNNVVAKFTTGASGKKYAIVYQKTAATYTVDGGQTYADATAFANAGTLYTDATATTVAASFADASTTYYKRTAVSNKGIYSIKIVTVQ